MAEWLPGMDREMVAARDCAIERSERASARVADVEEREADIKESGMAERVEGVGNEMYPLVTTPDGHVVVYRQFGDAWQVAATAQDVEFLTNPRRHRRKIEVVEVRPVEKS